MIQIDTNSLQAVETGVSTWARTNCACERLHFINTKTQVKRRESERKITEVDEISHTLALHTEMSVAYIAGYLTDNVCTKYSILTEHIGQTMTNKTLLK